MNDHLQKQPDLLPGLLNTLFEIALFQECANQWSLGRPMLALILVNEPVYAQLQARIISSQPVSRQAIVKTCMDKLMDDVQRNLEAKNRDVFTQVSLKSDLCTPPFPLEAYLVAQTRDLFC